MRGARRGVSAIVTIVLAVVTFLGGLGIGAFVLAPAPAAQAKLLLGTNTPFPPFEYYEGTALVGFDIELIQGMVTRAGYAYEWRDFTDFTALLLAVSAEGVDVGIGAITMNGATGAARNDSLDFTNPYYEADQAILKQASDATDYCAAADCTAAELDDAAYRVGVQDITTSYYWILDNLPNVTVEKYPSVTQVLQSLDAGSVDFVVIDKPAAQGIAAGNPSFVVEGTIQTDELYGFAVADGDPSGLVPKLNAALTAMRADGTYQALLDKYF
jgi:ABC-type amino acid transport substrate-binding protein